MIKKIILFTLLFLTPLFLKGQQGSFIKAIESSGKYKFEIPDSLLGKDILFGSRVVDISAPKAKVYSAGQMRRPPVVIRFRRDGKYILIEEITQFSEVEDANPIYGALKRNEIVGSVMIFDIEKRNELDNASIVDVTKYFSEEVQLAWPLPDNIKKGRLESRLSKILFMREYKDHLNVRSYYEFHGGKETFAITVQYFLLSLSDTPFMTRLNDSRVGYQPYRIRSYESGKGIKSKEYISRWRIEPAPRDIEAHASGKLVRPLKPIDIFIEPYFPPEWIPYIKLGIEDWNKAFEKIGFKDVLTAKEFPKDPEFDPYDIKTNVVRYLPLYEANAAGQIWTDPRSGEIINGEVLWWNNVVDLIKMWRFTQTAAADPRARAFEFDQEMMGEIIRYAIAHEVGHVLGLQHNLRSSYAYPVDSLRSPSFTQKYGTTASIMDYARFNHIAKPGDLERGVKMTPPHLGPFDYFSIEYGYKYIHNVKSYKEETPFLDSLFESKAQDPFYLFAPFIAVPISPDPSAQTESLGDNVLISSQNGITNTRIILDSLIRWTIQEGGTIDDVEMRYTALNKQYFRYISLAMSYIGGVYNYQGPLHYVTDKYVPVPVSKQKEALEFVLKHISESPLFLEREDINKILGSQRERLLQKQGEILSDLLGNFLLPRIINNNEVYSSNYGIDCYLEDLDSLLWKTTEGGTLYDKNIQISYLQALKLASTIKKSENEPVYGSALIINEAAFNQLNKTKERVTQLVKRGKNNKTHYNFLLNIIENK